MSLLKNNLNISTLYVHDASRPKSIEYCFLFLTSATFRSKTESDRRKQVERFRAMLSKNMSDILKDTANTSSDAIKNKIMKFPNGNRLPKLFLETDYVLGDEFVFVIEELVKGYRFVFVEREMFVLGSLKSEFSNQDKIIIIQKKGRDSYYPVFQQPEKYEFNVSDDVVNLIETFHSNTEQVASPLVSEPVDTNTNTYNTQDQTYIIDEEDIVFDPTEQDITVRYTNQHNKLVFTPQEEMLYLQNLLISSPYSENEKATGYTLQPILKNINVPENAMMNMYPIKVATTERHLEDWDIYIEEYDEFKQAFMNQAYINPNFYQQSDLDNGNKTANEDIVRNSFNNTFVKWNLDFEDFVASADMSDCESMAAADRQALFTKHNIKTTFTSRQKQCEVLLAYNFLEEFIMQELSKKTIAEMRMLAQEHAITSLPKSSSKSVLSAFLAKNHTSIFKYLFTLPQLKQIVKSHNLPIQTDDFDALFEKLRATNLVEYGFRKLKSGKHPSCEPDDVLTAILASTNDPTPLPTSKRSLQIFRHADLDGGISANGFYYQGNKDSSEFKIFDVANYINVLKNIEKFLPVKCTLYYHSEQPSSEEGIIQPLNDDSLVGSVLKIKTNNKGVIYYNLTNIHDNSFFVYPEFYEGYKYQKRDLDKNIFFYTQQYPYDDMLRFVSLSLSEYTDLFEVTIDSLKNYEATLSLFNRDIHNTLQTDLDILNERITPVQKKKKLDHKHVDTNITKRESKYDFLRFNNENISDTHKMFLLQKREYYRIIKDIQLEKARMNSLQTLDAKTPPMKSSSDEPKRNYRVENVFNTFEEVKEYKQQIQQNVEHNVDVDISIRKRNVERYLESKEDILNKYERYVDKISAFFAAVHNKMPFKNEMSYTKTHSSHMEGMEESTHDTRWMFVNTNPNLFHAPLDNAPLDNLSQQEDSTKQIDALNNLIAVAGVKITDTEQDYIRRSADTIVRVFIKAQQQKQSSSIASNADMALFVSFGRMVAYASFITLFAQYRYDITNVFKLCSKVFSLGGFPIDASKTDKSFTAYMACILFAQLKRKNKFAQSEKVVQSYIESAIRILFQQNPIIKGVFEKLEKNRATDKNKIKESNVFKSFKPYYSFKHVDNKIRDNMPNVFVIKPNFSFHQINETKAKEFNRNQANLFQLLCPKKKRSTKYSIVDKTMMDALTMNIINKPSYDKPSEATDENALDNRVSELIESFDNAFYKTNKVRSSEFSKIFIEQSAPEYKDSHQYYHLLDPNGTYRNALRRHTNMESYQALFNKHAIEKQSNALLTIIHMYESLKALLSEMVKEVTDDIFIFLNVSESVSLENDVHVLVSEFRKHLDDIVLKYKAQHVSAETLKSRAEIMREEDKQRKLDQYSSLSDEQMILMRELEETFGSEMAKKMMGADGDNSEPTSDDIEAEEMDTRNSDDNNDEE